MDISWGTCKCTSRSTVPKPSAGILEHDEMFDVLGDIINDDIEVDPVGYQSSNE